MSSSGSSDTRAVHGPWASRALFPGTGIPGDSGVPRCASWDSFPRDFSAFLLVMKQRERGQENTEFWGNETLSPGEGKLGEQDPHSAVLGKLCVLESEENLGVGCLDESEQGEGDFKNPKS